jgi:hypothetical protein
MPPSIGALPEWRASMTSLFKRSSLLVLLMLVIACDHSRTTPSSAASTPSPTAPSGSASFALGGKVVTSRTLEPVVDATVSIVNGPDAGTSTATDVSGNFLFTGLQQSSVMVNVSKQDYFPTTAPLDSKQTRQISLVWLGQAMVFTGQVTDALTSAPIAGAIVDINGRYRTASDATGTYNLTGYLDIGDSSVTYAFADGYEQSGRYVRGRTSQSFRLRRIERITAGDSWSVTVRPDDSLCSNNRQEPSFGLPGSGFLCRTVRVAVLKDGVMSLEAVSAGGGARPTMEVEALGGLSCCMERLENPTTITVRAGMEVVVNVEMPETTTTSQSFALTTSITTN